MPQHDRRATARPIRGRRAGPRRSSRCRARRCRRGAGRASPQLRPNFRSTRIGTSSWTASQPSRATSSPCSRVVTEQLKRIVHLQQRHDAFAPAGAHPQLGVPRRRALDQRIERRVGVGAAQPLAVPGMLGVRDAAPGFFDSARAGALGEDPGHFVQIPVPARAVVEHGVADARCLLLADARRAAPRTAACDRIA